MSQIHSTAIIDPNAKLGEGVRVGPYCVIGPNVTLSDRVELKSHVVVDGHTIVGQDTRVFPFASLGHAPQDLKFHGEPSQLIIGARNTIREHVTMNPGTKGGGMKTTVGDDGLYMVGVHIAHDCIVGNRVIMANNATLGGHVQVGDHVLIGGLAAVHQWVRIGSYAVIGGMSGVESDVIPYGRVKGERAHLAGLNLVGLERGGFAKNTVKTMQRAMKHLFEGDGTMDQRIEQMSNDYAGDETVMQMINFARAKERFGLCAPEARRAV